MRALQRMPLATLQRKAFTAWSQDHHQRALGHLLALKDKVTKQEQSLWTKNKEELVDLAVEECGLNRAEARRRTVQELRAEIKEVRDSIKEQDELARLPKGMAKMRKEELAQAMEARGLPSGGLTNANMMRRLRLWEAATQHYGRITITETEVLEFAMTEEYQKKNYQEPAAAASSTDSTWTITGMELDSEVTAVQMTPKASPRVPVNKPKAEALPKRAGAKVGSLALSRSSAVTPVASAAPADTSLRANALAQLVNLLEETAQAVVIEGLDPPQIFARLPVDWAQAWGPTRTTRAVATIMEIAQATVNMEDYDATALATQISMTSTWPRHHYLGAR